MVSSKDANEGTGNMQDHCPYQWFHRMGQGALSMVSSKDAKEVGNRDAQRDMRGISPVICGRKKLLDSGVWERNSLIQVFVLWLILS